MAGFALFAGDSYRNPRGEGQAEPKAMPDKRLGLAPFGASGFRSGNFRSNSRNIIAWGGAGALNSHPHCCHFREPVLDTRKLDTIDLRILAELQADGRITNVELSRRAKITAPPCLRRMRALEKAGYIRGYHADLNGKALGFEVAGFVFVGLASQKDADLKAFEESARGWPQVRECYMLSGE